ncbi:hypothetical protein [Pontibacter cellulosilyticus]|uniref:Uncharacterized protein n=1 Tax=Pontibacter cellulosilyticus TaxID=1720253 RepID=A0A923SIK7_9BACT|nr:hypothetical protein [Pontibacter cellulosilyticus]MBC5992707.1 hypothetical protein [Pontibacter cellulosilyticus]
MKFFYYLPLLAITLSCNSDDSSNEESRINESAIKIRVLDLRSEQIYQQSLQLIKGKNSAELAESIKPFLQFDDSLQLIKDELISAAGGYTTEALYYNAPAFNYVDDYFYGETAFRNNSHEFFFATLERLNQEINSLSLNTKLSETLEERFAILQKRYGVSDRRELFKNLSISEAVELIEAIRRQVAMGHQEHVINEIIKSNS